MASPFKRVECSGWRVGGTASWLAPAELRALAARQMSVLAQRRCLPVFGLSLAAFGCLGPIRGRCSRVTLAAFRSSASSSAPASWRRTTALVRHIGLSTNKSSSIREAPSMMPLDDGGCTLRADVVRVEVQRAHGREADGAAVG